MSTTAEEMLFRMRLSQQMQDELLLRIRAQMGGAGMGFSGSQTYANAHHPGGAEPDRIYADYPHIKRGWFNQEAKHQLDGIKCKDCGVWECIPDNMMTRERLTNRCIPCDERGNGYARKPGAGRFEWPTVTIKFPHG